LDKTFGLRVADDKVLERLDNEEVEVFAEKFQLLKSDVDDLLDPLILQPFPR